MEEAMRSHAVNMSQCNWYPNEQKKIIGIPPYGGIPYQLIQNLGIWIGGMVLFCLLRRKCGNYGRLALVDRQDSYIGEDDKHIFAWIDRTFAISDHRYLERVGRDAVQYLRFQRHLILFTCIVMFFSVGVILPINWRGLLQIPQKNENFGLTTIGNLPSSDELLWVHVAVVTFLFPLGIVFMRKFSTGLHLREFEEETADWEAVHGHHLVAARTLMVSGIPTRCCTKAVLSLHFKEAYPSLKVESIQPAYNVSELTSLHKQLSKAQEARKYWAERTTGGHHQMPRRWCCNLCFKCDGTVGEVGCHSCGTCGGGNSCCCCATVDALEFFDNEVEVLREKLEAEKEKIESKNAGIAFVTFESTRDALAVASDHKCWLLAYCPSVYGAFRRWCFESSLPKSSMSQDLAPDSWRVDFAPPVDDIYWENLHVSYRFYLTKLFVVNAALVIALVFLNIPALLIYNGEPMKGWFDWAPRLAWLPEEAYQTFGLYLFILVTSLIPVTVAQTDWMLGHWRRSTENLWIMKKVFIYLIVIVLILPSIGGLSIKGVIESADTKEGAGADTPGYRWDCIFLPDNGAFFVRYVITQSLLCNMLEFTRIPELLFYIIYVCIARSVPEVPDPMYEFMFGYNYSWMLLVFAMGMSYAVICPLITPFLLFYLVMKHGADRYNLFYAYKKSKISKHVHATAVNCVIVCLLLQQAFLMVFNITRSWEDDHVMTREGPGHEGEFLSARAVFSITVFTISLFLFVLQEFFGYFLGFSPIQYEPRRSSDISESSGSATPDDKAADIEMGLCQQSRYVPNVLIELQVFDYSQGMCNLR